MVQGLEPSQLEACCALDCVVRGLGSTHFLRPREKALLSEGQLGYGLLLCWRHLSKKHIQ